MDLQEPTYTPADLLFYFRIRFTVEDHLKLLLIITNILEQKYVYIHFIHKLIPVSMLQVL